MNQSTASVNQDRPLNPKGLTGFPVLGGIARNRGGHYIVSWLQRLSGLSLAAYLALHLYTLSSLSSPESFKAAMLVYRQPVFVFLAWTLALPLAFHAFNGMRLTLFELFGIRDESALWKWALGLGMGYVVLLTALMIQGGQTVSAPFFWAAALGPALAAVWAVAAKVAPLSLGWGWKLQRLTAAGLLVLIPAHFLFAHLNPMIGHDWGVINERLHNGFILVVDALMLLATIYHAGYGVVSVCRDHLPANLGFTALKALVVVVGLWAAFAGLRILWSC